MKTALIVSPNFPPSTLAGVHRARILTKYLPTCGWQPVVFCVAERYHEQDLDFDLAALVPLETRIIKVDAWPTKLSRAMGVGDVGIRGYTALQKAVSDFISQEGAEVLFITALPGFPLLMGPRIKHRFGIPFIADFQDPWLPPNYHTAIPLSKLWASHKIAAIGEPYVVAGADQITSVSEGTNLLLSKRYPQVPSDRFDAIPIGGDASDFEFLNSRLRPCPWIDPHAGRFTFAYVGNVWPQAYKTLEAIFSAISNLKISRPQLYQRLQFVFVGTSNQASAHAGEVVMPFARRFGIENIVKEEPRRIPYLDALNVMSKASALLMIGSDESHYTASKLYSTLLAKRPVLAVFHEDSSVTSIAREVGGIELITFSRTQGVDEQVGEISRIIQSITATNHDGPANIDKLGAFLGPAIANRKRSSGIRR